MVCQPPDCARCVFFFGGGGEGRDVLFMWGLLMCLKDSLCVACQCADEAQTGNSEEMWLDIERDLLMRWPDQPFCEGLVFFCQSM